MNKIIKLLMCFFVITQALPGCKKFLDVNENPNEPETVQENMMLRPIELNFADNLIAGWGTITANHFMQAIALNQTVPNVGTYLYSPVDANDPWGYAYITCLQNLSLLNQQAEENGNSSYAGIAKVLMAYTLGYTTDMWGDIPYTEALEGTEALHPAYDSQEEIYQQIQLLLDQGIAQLTEASGILPEADDYYYGGNTANWIKAAYTLKARYYMHLTKAPGHNAQEQANLALTALEKGFTANEEDMKMIYPGDAATRNRWYVAFLPDQTIVMSTKTVDTLVNREDPRLPLLVSRSAVGNNYNGRAIGTSGIGSFDTYSRGGSYYAGIGSSVYLLNYTEALFLRAEATLITAGAEAAQAIYEEAIRADMAKLGISDENAINQYLAARGTLTGENALERIMEEKTVANFLSPENFNDWRRTGYPILSPVPNALSAMPRRLIYPQRELANNPQPQHSGNNLTLRVWWDTE
ncbi:SusD/RagB family nutrient-binding outer membrane lipoprotein [Olivibacter sp. SDN3]|uniref:SusD/RagB family nutrient-binding outer membrane lipoprotein n=1 Tax=Olivibacter sp. SDN3 TaxID=2764720 RepID=UPI00210835FA|nr:SusD/RagB family nutrient-binding outer membrane lipoprotein [Olivibacter sp. SDN3]